MLGFEGGQENSAPGVIRNLMIPTLNGDTQPTDYLNTEFQLSAGNFSEIPVPIIKSK